MSIISRRSLKTGLATFGLAAVVATAVPATASADIVDDALNRLPSGPISCEQANDYWTTEAEYNSIRSQAETVALFHPRGGEIRDALARVDEAANRCGLKGGAAPVQQAPAQQNQQAPQAPAQQAPAPQAPAQNTGPAPVGQVITVPVAPGTPTVTVPVGDFVTFVLPDLLRIVADFLAQFGVTLPR